MEDKILKELSGVQKNILLKNYTTYKIGGPAKYFFVAKTKDDLLKAIKTAKTLKLPVFVLGGGSNVLISEKGFRGLVIKMQNAECRIENTEIYVGAGENIIKLSYSAAEAGLSGLEWAAGMPGTVGGAIYGSAQAFGTKVSDIVKSVEVINLKDSKGYLQTKNFTKEECQFSIKNSIFKKDKQWVIVSAVLELKRENPDKIKNQIKEFLEYRRAKHPMEFPSAGSVFINPERNGETTPAGILIAKCGLAGKKIGQAQISEKHSNFIINLDGATSKDVLSLIKLAQKEVKKKFNIKLEPEVQFVGF